MHRSLLNHRGAILWLAVLSTLLVGTGTIHGTHDSRRALLKKNALPTACISESRSRDVRDFGPFIADDMSKATQRSNTDTINKAIADAGRAGGGVVCLPSGSFFLATNPDRGWGSSVIIDVDNVTIWGAGMDSGIGGTRLRTPGEWVLRDGAVFRGNGIQILGTASLPARKNIVLRDFELDGGSGFTGNYGWPADPVTGDGWDITHKGIILAANDHVDDVTLERIWVHSYKGEVIYNGGAGMGKLTIRGIKSEDTNASTYNVTPAIGSIVEDSEFGKGRFWIEIGTLFAAKGTEFRNNRFHDAQADGAIALAQGDLSTQPYIFTSNRFENCPGSAFLIAGGVGGPVDILHNEFINCGGIQTSSYNGGPLSPNGMNQNITIESNDFINPKYLFYFYQHGKNIKIRRNNVRNLTNSSTQTTAIFSCATVLENVLIENNRFENVRAPEAACSPAAIGMPLFSNNLYAKVEVREGQGFRYLDQTDSMIVPIFEQAFVSASEPGVIASLSTQGYADGQKLDIFVWDGAGPVRFQKGAVSYYVEEDRSVAINSSIRFTFHKALQRWIEELPSSEPS
ncbi:MAG TPA: hypothetical protein VE954_18955 [Oligoflexus sp.]|uniref:right-handed parallel beta-helix repeat-containing protein n=1 Tax=Oligoflexus sp. TaxID=1971216 RepID=UPI002D2CCF8F|nr:hypothetical protein [Oligoflexus sp.]HYX35180.1 hypothetical protein [Oligoflexus sp.]